MHWTLSHGFENGSICAGSRSKVGWNMKKGYLIVAYGDNPATPGRFLADGLRAIGQPIKVSHDLVDFNKINRPDCKGLIVIDCPSRPPVRMIHPELAANIPKFYWTYHGDHVLRRNIELVRYYRADCVLMSSCLRLAGKFPAPVSFFPLAVPDRFFKGGPQLSERQIAIGFVGNTKGDMYASRRASLENIRTVAPQVNLLVSRGVYLAELAALYANTRIVYNDSINQTITLRIFEGLGARALVVSDAPPDQDTLLTPDRHFVRYSNETDKLQKIRHYLNALEEAQAIADRGFHWVMKHHTFTVRATQLVQLIDGYR